MEQNIHAMKLNSVSFDQIKEGTKKIEVRLYDEKRREIQLGDLIEFSKGPEMAEKVRTRVIGLLRYGTFPDLVRDYPPTWFGSEDESGLLKKIYSFYTPEREAEYGVLGIRIEVI